jgi:hypothetical protein
VSRGQTLRFRSALVVVGCVGAALLAVDAPRAAPRASLLISESAGLANAARLKGQEVRGPVFIFLARLPDVRRVRFYIDDPDMARKPLHVSSSAPFGLLGLTNGRLRPLDVRQLAAGRHSVTAAVEFGSGSVTLVSGRFTAPHLAVSLAGSDRNRCTGAAPCRSLKRAFAVARPGDVVEIQPGDYGDQHLVGDNRGQAILIRPAAEGVSVDDLIVDADNVEVRDMRVGYWEARAGSDGFTARNLDSNQFGVYGGSNVKVLGGDYGPSYNPGGSSSHAWITWGNNGTVLSRNVLIDGAYFHDMRRGTPDDHMECLFITGVDGLTIRNSRFQRCDVFSIFFGTPWWSGSQEILRNITIENNFFDRSTNDSGYSTCCTHYALRISDDWDRIENFRFAYNSLKQGISISSPTLVNVTVVGNVSPWGGCDSGVSYAYNVWQHSNRQRCAPTDRPVTGSAWGYERLGFLDPSVLDLRLTTGSPAIGAGDPGSYPARDIRGRRRPVGGKPDAGAVESG